MDFDIDKAWESPAPRASTNKGGRPRGPAKPSLGEYKPLPPVPLRPVPPELKVAPKVAFDPNLKVEKQPKFLDEIDRMILATSANQEQLANDVKKADRAVLNGRIPIGRVDPRENRPIWSIIGPYGPVIQSVTKEVAIKVLLNKVWSKGKRHRKMFDLAIREGFAFRFVEIDEEALEKMMIEQEINEETEQGESEDEVC